MISGKHGDLLVNIVSLSWATRSTVLLYFLPLIAGKHGDLLVNIVSLSQATRSTVCLYCIKDICANCFCTSLLRTQIYFKSPIAVFLGLLTLGPLIFANESRFFRFRAIFQACSLLNEVVDPPFFLHF